MTPNRVAYVVNVFPKLSETFIAGELAELRRRGVELRVLSLRQPTEPLRHDFVARARLDKITCYQPAQFASLLREFAPDLLHAHFATEPTAAARDLAKDLGVPFLFTAHGYDIRRKAPADFAERAAAARAVVTVSNANARCIAGSFGVPLDRIHVIPCGVDTDRFRPADGRGAGGHDTASRTTVPFIVNVARHVRVKNLGLLLEACALLRRRNTRFRCVLVGDGPLRGELQEKSRRLGLQSCLKFTGALKQAEVINWWRRASVAALTSDNEGMPVCLMEAAACGVPAVATAVGGVPELVQDGVTGLLTRPGDAADLASALATILANPRFGFRLGRAARERVEQQFSVHRQVNGLLGLWSRLLAEQRR